MQDCHGLSRNQKLEKRSSLFCMFALFNVIDMWFVWFFAGLGSC